MASSLSTRICIVCGANGSIRTNGWFRVLCDEHERDYRAGGLQNCSQKKDHCLEARLSNTDVTTLLHGLIWHDVKFNDLEKVQLTMAESDEDEFIHVETPECCIRVAGMLALLERFSAISLKTEGESE
jgi:hypothetical protein